MHASPDDLALAGGETPHALAVVLGEEPIGGAPDHIVRFSPWRQSARELLISPYGDGLWRRQPWPAADDLFALDEPPDGAPTLVVAADVGRRATLIEAIRGRGLDVMADDRLYRMRVEQAGAVVLLDAPGRFPPLAFAVAAAARLLILAQPRVLFGLQDRIDCLLAPANDDPRLVDLVDHAAARARDFAPMRRLGRLAAERHRASDVYARLGTDLTLGLDGAREGR